QGEKPIIESMEQMGGSSEEQAGDRNGKEHEQRHHVLGKLLHGNRAAVTRATPHGNGHSRQHHDGGNVQHIESQKSGDRAQAESKTMLPEQKCLVQKLVVRRAGEVDPAEGKRKGDSARKNATPGNQPVSNPALARALLDESLLKKIVEEELGEPEHIPQQLRRTDEDAPSREPVFSRWGTPQPHGIPVGNSKTGKERSSGVWH